MTDLSETNQAVAVFVVDRRNFTGNGTCIKRKREKWIISIDDIHKARIRVLQDVVSRTLRSRHVSRPLPFIPHSGLWCRAGEEQLSENYLLLRSKGSLI